MLTALEFINVEHVHKKFRIVISSFIQRYSCSHS